MQQLQQLQRQQQTSRNNFNCPSLCEGTDKKTACHQAVFLSEEMTACFNLLKIQVIRTFNDLIDDIKTKATTGHEAHLLGFFF